MTSYWAQLTEQRLSRRRTLSAVGGAGIGAVLLAACGGKENDQQDASSLVSRPEETTSKAVPGGIWQDQLDGDILHLDINVNTSSTSF